MIPEEKQEREKRALQAWASGRGTLLMTRDLYESLAVGWNLTDEAKWGLGLYDGTGKVKIVDAAWLPNERVWVWLDDDDLFQPLREPGAASFLKAVDALVEETP